MTAERSSRAFRRPAADRRRAPPRVQLDPQESGPAVTRGRATRSSIAGFGPGSLRPLTNALADAIGGWAVVPHVGDMSGGPAATNHDALVTNRLRQPRGMLEPRPMRRGAAPRRRERPREGGPADRQRSDAQQAFLRSSAELGGVVVRSLDPLLNGAALHVCAGKPRTCAALVAPLRRRRAQRRWKQRQNEQQSDESRGHVGESCRVSKRAQGPHSSGARSYPTSRPRRSGTSCSCYGGGCMSCRSSRRSRWGSPSRGRLGS